MSAIAPDPFTEVHAALVRLSLPMLPKTLRMPEGSEVHGFFADPHRPDLVYLRVTHPSLPKYRSGGILTEVDLVMHEPTVETPCPDSEFGRGPVSTNEAPQILSKQREDDFIRAINTKNVEAPYFSLRDIVRMIAIEATCKNADKHRRRGTRS